MNTTNNPLLIRSTSPAEFGRALATRRRDQPVYFDDNLRSWIILDQQAIHTALHNPEVFSNSYQKGGPFGETFVALDGPEHLKLRRIYARAFSPRALKAYEDTVITACAQRISARIAQRARCDLIDEFCFPLPMDIISALVGIKAEDVYVTKDWVKTLVLWAANQHKPEFVAQGKEALRRCIEHLRPSVDDVLENPREGNILSQLVEAHREQAAALDHDAILNLAAGLLVAGYETTSWTLAGTLAALLLHPDSLARIRHDRSLLMPAVEEAMRWCSSVVVLPRVVLAETVVCDRTIAAGNVVMLCFSSSHYDEALHANPEVYAIDRNPEHLNFGGGPHFCLGAPWRAWRPASGYRRCSTARRTCGSIRRSGRCFCSGHKVRRCTGPTRCASCSRQTPPPEAGHLVKIATSNNKVVKAFSKQDAGWRMPHGNFVLGSLR